MTIESAELNDLTEYQRLGVKTNSTPFQRCLNAGLLNDIDESFATEVREYWESNYGKRIDPILNIAFMNLTGKKDTRIIPGHVLRKKILPLLNDYNMSIGYLDKNLSDTMINAPRSAKDVLKNINGTYFDADNHSIDIEHASKMLLNSYTDLIIKPSRTNNGKKIAKLKVKDGKVYLNGKVITIHNLEEIYSKNFIIQKAIQQHSIMAAPHPSSVNTLRMYTFRWKNEIRYLPSFARFGGNNHINDNMGTGGLCLGLTDSGKFYNVAVDDYLQTYTHHPTTGFCFDDLEPIPNFEEVKQFIKDCHKNVLHLNIISWDVAIDSDSKPIFIEANFSGPLWLTQFVTQRPAFGELTEEVLQYANNELKTTKPTLQKKDRVKKEKKENKNKKQKENQIKELKDTLETKDDELKRIKTSKSWRYTSLFRSVLAFFKR